MKKTLLLACLTFPLVASAIGFEVLPNPDGITSLRHLNHRGDYVGLSNGDIRSNVGGVVTTRSPVGPTGLRANEMKVSENGWLYGYAGAYGGVNDYRPLVALPGEGWRQFQGTQANAVGVTGAGKVLLRLGPFGSRSSWWDPVQGTEVLATTGFSFAMACNLAGDAIYDILGRFGRAGEQPFQLTYQGWNVASVNLNEQGDIVGYALNDNLGGSSVVGLIWDRSGNIVFSSASLNPTMEVGFRDVNNRREVVGARAVGTTNVGSAVFYSQSTGIVDINANLTATSLSYNFTEANYLSDTGLILATGRGPSDTFDKQYLLRVVPEPASMAALGVGLLGVWRPRRSGRKNPKMLC